MKPARFALAVPYFSTPGRCCPPEVVRRIGDLCGPRARLWTDEDLPWLALGDEGYVLGPLFSRSSMALYKCVPADAPHGRDAEDLAAWLMRECWGAYCAVLVDRRTNTLQAVVDPSGLLPVYRLDLPQHCILASEPTLITRACGAAPGVCWQSLGQHLLRPELRSRSTCLKGICELTPGELVCLSAPEMAGFPVWQAERHLPTSPASSFEEAAEELRDIAVGVIGAWADWLGPVAVAASGGVDSSLICAALSQQGKPFGCVTVSTSDRSGDERKHVELLAEHLQVPVAAQVYEDCSFDPWRPASAGLPRPSRKSFLRALDVAVYRAADELGMPTILDGNGGDNLFCYLHSAAPVVDRLRAGGIGAGSWNTLLDMCRITGCDLPAMAGAVWRRILRGGSAAVWPTDARLLESPDDAAVPEPLRPWLDAAVGRHPGKRDHLVLIMRVQNHLHDLAAGLPRFSPLMSQPLLEFCLSVPTWLWCRGGINRALARAAFSDLLPPQILSRTSKAGPDSFIRACFEANRPALREILLEGLLASRGLLDREAAEQALGADAHGEDSIVYRLLDLAEADVWARSWET
jgi:asparagine synthase (glutamine-hydrolysing)